MEFGLDSAIERLNALKLHVPTQNNASATPSHNGDSGNQRDEEAVDSLHDRFSRMAMQLQDQHERKLKDQEAFFVARIQHEMQQMQHRVDALEHQNHLLRQAVASADTYKAQVADQEMLIATLQDQVKQLRLANYRLQYMVQQTERSGPNQFMPPPPPDIF